MEGFPRFLHLPLEIQDRVWELSVPIAAPTAYQVRLRFRAMHLPPGALRPGGEEEARVHATPSPRRR